MFLLPIVTFASDLDITQKNSLFAGLAIPTGNYRIHRKPVGANGGFESYAQIEKYLGLGGHLECSWQPLDFSKDTSEYLDGSLSYWDISATFKGLTPFTNEFMLYADLSPGFYVGLDVRHSDYKDVYTWTPDFGLSFGGGAIIGVFVIGWHLKIVFTSPESTKWMTVTVGLCG